MKTVLTILTLFICTASNAQKTDFEIVNALLGKNFLEANNTLTSLGVWFYYHHRDTRNSEGEDFKAKFYSIENSNKVTKVWTLRYNREMIINEIIINFRSDDRGQLEDMQKMQTKCDDFNIGRYSTDLIYRLK